RLPEKYRAPIVLCYLEGWSHEEAARQLQWPVGTVKTRLSRGRERLRRRLVRDAAFGAAPLPVVPPMVVPPNVAASAVQVAAAFSRGHASSAGAISVSLAAQAAGVVQLMVLSKLRSVLLIALATGAIVSGAGFLSHAYDGRGPVPAQESM